MRRSKVVTLWVVIPLIVVAGLGACRSQSTSTTDEADAGPTGPPGQTGVDGPVMRHLETFADDGDDGEIIGVLQIEGDCLYVTLDVIGERYPIVWPASTSWDPDTGRVFLPNGITSVGHGDTVYSGGGYRYVDDLEAIAGQAATELARRCVDNQNGEIAVVNNQSGAIRSD